MGNTEPFKSVPVFTPSKIGLCSISDGKKVHHWSSIKSYTVDSEYEHPDWHFDGWFHMADKSTILISDIKKEEFDAITYNFEYCQCKRVPKLINSKFEDYDVIPNVAVPDETKS